MNWRFFLNIGVSKQEEPIVKFAKRLFNLDIWLEIGVPILVLVGALFFRQYTIQNIAAIVVPVILFLPLLLLVHKKRYTLAVILKLSVNCVFFIVLALTLNSIFHVLLVFTVSLSALTFLPKRTRLTRLLFGLFSIVAAGLFVYESQILHANAALWEAQKSFLNFFIILFTLSFLYKIIALMLLYQVSIRQNKVNYHRYQFLFDNSNEGMMLLEDGEITEVNQTLINMLGYEKHELKNTNIEGNTPLNQIANLVNNLRYANNLTMERTIKNRAEGTTRYHYYYSKNNFTKPK